MFSMNPHAVLFPLWFDIDGTLLHAHRVGKDAFQQSLADHFGWDEDLTEVRFAGNTDLHVLGVIAARNGLTKADLTQEAPAFFHTMQELLDRHMEVTRPTPIPGAHALLSELAERSDTILELLTGNARSCAFIKLKHVDLDHYFSEGGFGDEHPERDELAIRSADRLRTRHSHLQPGVVLGDTPRDVQAAKRIGAKALGIASGAYSESELADVGADLIVEDLTPTDDLRRFFFS